MFNFSIDHYIAIGILILIYFGLMDIALRAPFPTTQFERRHRLFISRSQ